MLRTRERSNGKIMLPFIAITFIVAVCLAVTKIPLDGFSRSREIFVYSAGPKKLDRNARVALLILVTDDYNLFIEDYLADLRLAVLKNEMYPEYFEKAKKLETAHEKCKNLPSTYIKYCVTDDFNGDNEWAEFLSLDFKKVEEKYRT